MNITDTIYDYRALPIVKKAFPEAKTEDASDFIHESRFEVSLQLDAVDWFAFLLREGIAGLSLLCQLAMYTGTPHHEDLKSAIERVKAEDRGHSLHEESKS